MKSRLLTCFLFGMVTTSLVAQARYTVTDLGQLSSRTSNSAAFGINDNGEVAVTLPSIDPFIQAYKWDKYQALQNLTGLTTNANSVAKAINSSGSIAGWTTDPSGLDQATLWKDGGMVTLSLPATGSRAMSINDSGQVVGEFTGAVGKSGFLWDPATGFYNIGTLSSTSASAATHVNNFQEVVGYSTNPTNVFPHTAFIWSRQSGMRALLPKFSGSTVAYAINDSGNVVGYAMNKTSWKAFITNTMTGRTTYYELPAISLKASKYSVAYSINSTGQVVGESNTKAFLIEKGSIFDLNAQIAPNTGWVLSTAYGINQSGQIVGVGKLNGEAHGFLLTPVK